MASVLIPTIILNPIIEPLFKFFYILNFFLIIYPQCADLLFLSLAWMLVKHLKIFTERIKKRVRWEEKQRLFTSKSELLSSDERILDEWKRHYLLIDRLVQELNLSFGFVQLVLVSSTFLRFVNGMFKVILNFKEDFDEEKGGYMELHLFLILEFISLSLGAYVSQRIDQEVTT